MSVFPKTRAAAGYIAGTGPGELARTRAAILLARLGACEDILPGGEGDVPAALHGLLRDLMLAVRDLAEISEYLTLFRAPHGDTADAAEAWENLRHFLRPAERWPALCNPGRAAHEPEATT